MASLTGSIGQFALIGGDLRVLDIPLEGTTAFFKDIAIKSADIAANMMGIYSFLPVGRWGRAKMSKLSTPRGMMQSRKNCATWNPKGRITLGADEINTFPVEYMGEQCSDPLFDQCLEYVLGTGNGKRDITSTPEGRQLFAQVIQKVFLGLGNDFHDIVRFSNLGVITDANTNGTWNQDAQTDEEWVNWHDQQTISGLNGHDKLLEDLKALAVAGDSTLDHFNVDLPSGDFSGGSYTGSDVTTIFDAAIDAARPNFKVLLDTQLAEEMPKVVLRATRAIWKAYHDKLKADYKNIPEGYYLMIDGVQVPGVLKYEGIPVLLDTDQTQFDHYVGVHTHRVTLTANGNMVVAYDVPQLEQFAGMGLRIEQSQRLKDKGITYMYTNYRVGMGLADTDFACHGSRIIAA